MFELVALIKAAGYLGLFGIIFAESGLLVGFFFPGDSLLFTAGLLASRGFLNIWILVPAVFVAAVLGDSTGYFFGKKFGPKIFKRDDSFFFHKDNVKRAEKFFAKYGAKTIILARFMPVVRTFAPILAGVGKMNYHTFLSFNIIGGALWSIGLTALGYSLGEIVPDIDKYLLPIIALIIFLSILPSAWHLLKERLKKHRP